MDGVSGEGESRRVEWNRRYKEGFYKGTIEPHTLLRRFWNIIPGRLVADIAMGSGRDAIFLVGKGFFVTGLESSVEAINIAKKSLTEKNHLLLPVLGDARYLPYRRNSLDGVIVFYFLQREIIKEIVMLLKKGGILIYETYLERQNAFDRHRNPEYLLKDGELFGHLKELELLLYEEIIENRGGKKKAIARIVGKKR